MGGGYLLVGVHCKTKIDMDNLLNNIGSICSILSLIIAIFIAGNVIKIKNSIKIDNSEKKSVKSKTRISGDENIVSGNDTNIQR